MPYAAADIFQGPNPVLYGPAGLHMPELHCTFRGVASTAKTYSREPGMVTTDLRAGHSSPAREYESRNLRVNGMGGNSLHLVISISGCLDNRAGLPLING